MLVCQLLCAHVHVPNGLGKNVFLLDLYLKTREIILPSVKLIFFVNAIIIIFNGQLALYDGILVQKKKALILF